MNPEGTTNTQTAVQQESPKTNEALSKQQTMETKIVGSTFLRGRYEQTVQSLSSKTIVEATSFLEANPGIRAIATLKVLDDYQEDNTKSYELADKPITTQTPSGKESRITRILGRDKDNFLCEVEGENKPIPIPRTEVFGKQLAASQEDILSQFNGQERELVELYIKTTLGGDQALEGKTPEEVNQLIEATAREAGVLTVSDVRAAVDRMLPEIAQTDPAQQLTPEQQAQNDRREKMIEALDKSGKNIVDLEVLTDVFNSQGLTPEQIAQQSQASQARIVEAQARVTANPQDQEAQRALASAKAEGELIAMTQLVVTPDGPMATYLDRMARGEIDPVKGKAAVSAFREGNIEGVILAMRPDLAPDPSDTPEQAEDKNKKKKELEDEGKKNPNILLLLLAAVVFSTQAVTSTTSKIG